MRVVLISVNYADMLRVTLPAWQKLLPAEANIVVVTTLDDRDTQRVTREVGVHCHTTTVFAADGATFNKAAALDEGFGFDGPRSRPADGEPCLALDADSYPCGSWPAVRLDRDTLYGCARYHCRTPVDLRAHLTKQTKRTQLKLISGKARPEGYEPIVNTPRTVLQMAHACLGFFQWFRSRPGRRFGSFPTASKYDIAFRRQFARRVGLRDPYILHLGEQRTANWTGRIVAPWTEEVA